jgi:lysine 2,3-aminomutase
MQHQRGCPETVGDLCDEPPLTTEESGAAPDSQHGQSWNDWRWQMRNRIRTLQQLGTRFKSLPVTQGMAAATAKFPLAITPYYASLIRTLDGSDPVFQMCVPQRQELYDPPCLKDDPLAEDEHMPVPGLVHRYPDRALLIATTTCSTYCRHCTRKRVAGQRESSIAGVRLGQITEYLSVHPEIKDVVISGGDPFTMPTDAIEKVLAAVRSVSSVDIVRFGTRTPVVMPMRITDELVQMLRKYHPVYVNTHFNHPSELTPDAIDACRRLADAGIPVGNQTVLLRGVNDDAQVLEELFRKLVRHRVRPYYLFQCDLVHGVEHFRTPLSRGIEVMEYLRGRLSGLAIPTFVVDAPHGGGKIPVLPNYVVSSSPSHTVLRNYEGMMVAYPEPGDLTAFGAARDGETKGVWELLHGEGTRNPPRMASAARRRKARVSAMNAMQLDMPF